MFKSIAMLLMVSGLVACQKADEPGAASISTTTPVNPTTPVSSGPYQGCKVAGESQTPSSSILRPKMTYSYDRQGRLLFQRTTFSDKGDWQERTYTYKPETVEITFVHGGGTSIHYRGVLNSAGYVQYDNRPTTYTYDADGYLIRQSDASVLGTFEVKDGNVVKDEFIPKGVNTQKTVTVYQYDTTRPNWPVTYNGFYDTKVAFSGRSAALYGKPNRNLLVRQEVSVVDGSGVVYHKSVTTYRYAYDQQGRVIRKTESNPDDPSMTLVNEYTYTCK